MFKGDRVSAWEDEVVLGRMVVAAAQPCGCT